MKKIMSSLCFIAAFIVLSIQTTVAQTVDATTIVTDTLSVNGDCGMCKKKIETACFGLKGVQKANWDDETLTLVVTYDSKKTSSDAILKRIALVGYDNEKYRAADKAYFKLEECCQYDRSRVTTVASKKE
ncbi:MAG: cation transporter [Saprospiraceae bacterium]|nr:cation transporter [Saprospiraceae bacterium]